MEMLGNAMKSPHVETGKTVQDESMDDNPLPDVREIIILHQDFFNQFGDQFDDDDLD